MARKPRRSRVEINRGKLETVQAGLADGVFDLARAIGAVASANAPDSPLEPYPTGEGLPRQIGAMVYVGGRRTHEWAEREGSPNLPRGSSVRARGGIIGFVGAGFPAMFQELGTVHHPAQPFVTPAASEIIGSESRVILSSAMQRRLRGERSANTGKIRARIAASRAAKESP